MKLRLEAIYMLTYELLNTFECSNHKGLLQAQTLSKLETISVYVSGKHSASCLTSHFSW